MVHDQHDDLRARIDALEVALAALQTDYAALAREVRRLGGRAPQSRRNPPAPAAPRVMRPVDYWVEHLPDFGDGVTREQAERYLARPRVRPEDIELTDAERAWRPSRPRSAPRLHAAPSDEPMPAAGPTQLFWLLIGTLLVLVLLAVVHQLFFR